MTGHAYIWMLRISQPGNILTFILPSRKSPMTIKLIWVNSRVSLTNSARPKDISALLLLEDGAFSTEARTAHIFRNGVKPGNRERLAASLVNFVLQNDLDGIDFDWEYPGVPDMTWLPPSSPDEAPNYLEFLKLVRLKLPQKSISIAAPASFWYLKAFPIKEISKVVDYIVYMTYDL
jgi:hypothetical protein